MSYFIDQFDQAKLDATRETWINSAEALGIPSLEYNRILQWASTRIDYKANNGDSYAYGIFHKDSQEAVAIVDLVYTKRSNGDVGWLKMLDVSLSPTFAPTQILAVPERYNEVLAIYASAILGTAQLTSDHKARVVKLYGRDDDLFRLFVALNERLHTLLQNATSKMEGRWLVISAH
ncbi:hypothetical protein [Undibacterium curvum]|uniref:hypothetical protein n=1 Tax=Undibacterium curvum TaxID=2762294 RepID=UPI003D12485F